MTTGTMFIVVGLLFTAAMIVNRAFSRKAQEVGTGEFGCLVIWTVFSMIGIGLAVDHLVVGIR